MDKNNGNYELISLKNSSDKQLINEKGTLVVEEKLNQFEKQSPRTPKNKIQKNLYLAKYCLEIEKYEDAIKYIDDLIKGKNEELTEEERNIFILIYRRYITDQRNTWKTLYQLEEKEKLMKTGYVTLINEIRNNIEEIIKTTLEKIIYLTNNYILNKVFSNEARAFFYKVKGDFYRYLSELSYGEELNTYIQNAFQNYKESVTYSSDVEALNIIKLGNFLNFAVFQYEVMNNTAAAIKIAQHALNDAANELKIIGSDEMIGDDIKDSLRMIEILKENFTNWTTEVNEAKGIINK